LFSIFNLQSLTNGQKPPQLVRLATTRWLSWYGAVKSHSEQYTQLKTLFRTVANTDTKEKCFMAHHLAALHEDMSHILYLTFLRPILREVTSINVVFQSSVADISKIYRDLKIFIFSLANRIIKPEALKQSQPGMLRLIELQALKIAMQKRENFKPIELVNYGENFWKVAYDVKLPDEKLRQIQNHCTDFLVKFIQELIDRLPSCIEAVEKLRGLSPNIALGTKGRPELRNLPIDIIRKLLLLNG